MIKRKRVTISDVAKVAGVSKQTVSRVINNKPDVADSTRERIKDVIATLGYHPDPIARSLKGQSCTLGCITPSLSDYNFSNIVQAAQEEARNNGFFMLTGSAATEYEVLPLLSEIMNRRVDGLLVINPRDDGRYRHLLPLIQQGVPIVYLKNHPIDELVSAVCLDDELGGYLATHHLLHLGHTEIATIKGPNNQECTHERLIGFQKAHQEAGSTPNSALIVQGDWSAQSGYEGIMILLEQRIKFSAVFAQNDIMAVGAIRALRGNGIRVPQEVSIIGYDNIPLSAFIDPPLTTIHQPTGQFGRIGVKLLIEAISDQPTHPQVVMLKPEIKIRESCLPYR